MRGYPRTDRPAHHRFGTGPRRSPHPSSRAKAAAGRRASRRRAADETCRRNAAPSAPSRNEAWPMARRRACTRHTRVLTRTSRRTRAADGTAARIDAWMAAWTAESTRTHAQPGHAHPRAAEAAQAARRTAEAGSARRGVSEAVPCNKPCTARGGPRRALLKARSAATPQDGS